MNITRILIIVLVLVSISVQARMYQWNDPDTGITQLSGRPPAWYRSDTGGPRVIVFDKGKIIDDTNIKVSDEERESLRIQALLKVEQDREVARQKMLQSEQIKTKLDAATEGKEPTVENGMTEPSVNETESTTAESDNQPSSGDQTEEQLRRLLSEWDKQITENAKREAGSNYMNIRQGTERAEQDTDSTYIRMENKSSE